MHFFSDKMLSYMKNNCFILETKVMYNLFSKLKGSDQWKMRGVEKLANVRRLYRTVAMDVCLFFYEVVVFSATYFRFLFVKLN